MDNKILGKRILVSSTDVMMIQFLIPHVLYLCQNGALVDVACSSAEGYQKEGYEKKIKDMLPVNSRYYHVSTERTPFSLKNIRGFKDLQAIMAKTQYDFIWTNEPVMGVMTRLAAQKSRKGGAVVMYLAHGYHFFKGAPKQNWIYYPVEKVMSKFCDLITVINWEDYEFTKKHFKVPVFHIDGIGLRLDKFDKIDVNKEVKRKELNVEKDDILILSVGELQARKNHEVILKAISRLNNKKIKYIICGRGELLDYLKELAQKLGIANQVSFLGHRYDIDEILSVADIFAHPSQREGLGIAAIEAMAAGLPLITSNVQGIKDYVKNEYNGYCYGPYDIDGFVDGLDILIKSNKLREQYGLYNKECAKKYSIEKSVDAVCSIICKSM